MKLPTEIVVGSGGARGIVALGAAIRLQSSGYFHDARVFSGTSVGAVIATGLALGVNLKRMMHAAMRHPFQPDIAPRNFGMDSGRNLTKLLRRMLGLKKRMTLQELHHTTGNTVRICVCNVTDRCVEYWTHKTHPEVSVLKALRISCSIPLIFAAVTHDDKLYVDGAVVDPLPVSLPESALAIGFVTPRAEINSMQDFMESLQTMRVPTPKPRYFLQLDPGDLDQFNLSLDANSLKEHFAKGQDQASSWIKKNV